MLGVFFRFYRLNHQYFWVDESITLFQVAGFTEAEILREVNYKTVISPDELLKYQRVSDERSVIDVIHSLRQEDLQHPPLYYILLYYWIRLFGGSIACVRCLSALFSLLTIGGIYWLARSLFESRRVAWLAVGLVAISPFQVVFAQEARPYSLWGCLTVISSVALLRVLEVTPDAPLERKATRWTIYTVLLVLGLYTHLFFVFVVAAHMFYVLIADRFRPSGCTLIFSAAVASALLAFAPWVAMLLQNYGVVETTTGWARGPEGWGLLKRWAGCLTVAFLDPGYDVNTPARQQLLMTVPTIASVWLVCYSLWFLLRHGSRKASLFVAMLIGAAVLPLVVHDFLRGGGRLSSSARFLTPVYIGVHLAVAHMLAAKLAEIEVPRKIRFFTAVSMLVFGAGVLSGVAHSRAEIWWNTGSAWLKDDPHSAMIINQSKQPLVISDMWLIRLMPLAHRLAPHVRLQVEPSCYMSCYSIPPEARPFHTPQVASGFDDVFVFNPSTQLINTLQKKYSLISVGNDLWQLGALPSADSSGEDVLGFHAAFGHQIAERDGQRGPGL
ncbi:MAG: glycosyltransferase family 39 protein [Verrucomicrobiia bacterium]